MPIYEYACRACGHQFEVIVLPASTAPLACPACQGQNLERLLSSFAVSSDGIRRANLTTAKRRQANSGDLKDQKIAEDQSFVEHMEEHGIDPKRPGKPIR